jgi:hypothetical protein
MSALVRACASVLRRCRRPHRLRGHEVPLGDQARVRLPARHDCSFWQGGVAGPVVLITLFLIAAAHHLDAQGDAGEVITDSTPVYCIYARRAGAACMTITSSAVAKPRLVPTAAATGR